MLKNLLNKFKGNFTKKPEKYDINDFIEKEKCICDKCKNGEVCYTHVNGMYIDEIEIHEHVYDYKDNHKNLLLIDDNSGMISFLKEDIKHVTSKLNIDNLNLFTFDGPSAVFELEVFLLKNPNIKFNYAIIDLTFGGRRTLKSGRNIVYTGIDVLNIINSRQNGTKFILFTGNSLNPSIKSNKALVDKFYKENGYDLMDVILFKTSVDMDMRREELEKRLFN